MKNLELLLACIVLATSLGCGGGNSGSSGTPPSVTLSLASNSAQVFQGQASTQVNATVTRSGTTNPVTLTITGLPTGATDTIQSPGAGNSGSITLSAGSASAGTYPLIVNASDGTAGSAVNLSFTIGATDVISANLGGSFSVAMSTSFQPAEWDYQFFQQNPGAVTSLGGLQSKHIRIQGISQGVPQGSEGTASTAWNFSTLDAVTQPVLSEGDHSPEFQIAKAPAFQYSGNNSSNPFTDLTFSQFAGYSQDLVRYYNTGGFSAGGQTYVSPSYPNDKITWWGIYNEPNLNNSLTPQQYTDMYNAVVPAMQAIDPTIKFAALELSDFNGQPQAWLPTFVSGVTAHVDVMATHFYSSCNQSDSDVHVFSTIPQFVADVQYFYSQMTPYPALDAVPVWVTENNVNADFSGANGMSVCNPNQKFVDDQRGSSPFFAAWRPYVFSQLGKAGVQALYHWDFDADKQFGEVDYTTGSLQLSYWVDYWLARMFPSPPGANLLQYTATDDGDIETLPVINGDGSVVIMVANRAINAAGDNNGPGAPRSVLIDVSGLRTFSTGSLLVIDKNTSVSSGPVAAAVTPAAQMPVTLDGYSVAFLTLKP